METKQVNLSRVNYHITYPANFQLVAAMNPCRCGYFGYAKKECGKAPICAKNYRAKISGPILDRIDIFLEIPSVPLTMLNAKSVNSKDNQENIKHKVITARKIQLERYKKFSITNNSQANAEIIKDSFNISPKAQNVLLKAANQFDFSTRNYFNIMKVARTCADLELSDEVLYHHMCQAVSYRLINY